MAHTGIFATQDEILTRAGAKVAVEISGSDAKINDLAAQSESIINCITKNNFSDSYDDLNGDVKRILSSASAAFCAIHMIAHKMDAFTSRTEAEDMLNVQRDSFVRDINILRDQEVVDFINNA